MNKYKDNFNPLKWMPLLTVVMVTACGEGKNDILGSSGNAALAPTIVSTAPASDATGISVHNPVISATFNDAVAAFGNGASFVVTCSAPCTNPLGTATLDSTQRIARFTPDANLQSFTRYRATITGNKNVATGLVLANPYTWEFTTGVAPTAVTVTAVAPVADANSVSINTQIISADFSEPVTFKGATGITLACVTPCISPNGVASLSADNKVINFTLSPGTQLMPMTRYTTTVAGATSVSTGAALTAPFMWSFTTGSTSDTTRPRVSLTVPDSSISGPITDVPANRAVSAIFSENVVPATISASSFTLTCATPCVNPTGSVTYAVGTQTATFTPSMPLASNTTYTARITQAVTDAAGNALAGNQAIVLAASDYVWMFTTTAVAASAPVSVAMTQPVDDAASVCPESSVNATFNVPSGARMDPRTVNSSTFTLAKADTAKTPVTATAVTLDKTTGRVASFQPQGKLVVGTTYTATLKGGVNGVKDTAIPANSLNTDYHWDFTVSDCSLTPPIIIPLGSIFTFGTFGGSAGTTNQGIFTVINGDIGTTAVSTAVTGFHDSGAGCTYTETELNKGIVNGKIYTSAPPPTVACPQEGTAVTAAIAAAAHIDAVTAYNALVAQPGGTDPGAGNLANLVLVPGVYTAAAGSFMIQGGDVVLDAQGNTNATWIFQMASSLTVGGPGAAAPQSVRLVNGAQAKNVFWQVGTAATINAGGGGIMVGTIISQSGAAISTDGNVPAVVLNGRVISLNASVTMVNTVINVPVL